LVEVDNKFVFQNESNPHLKFALAKLVNFTINTDIKKSVYNFLLSDKEFLVLYGESGIGKSSIMADISSSWKFSFSNMYTFEYYVGWGKKLSKEDIFYSLVEFLRANLFPKDMKYEESSNISFLLKEYIDEVPEDIEVLILIDALDQLKEEDSQALLYFFIQNSRKNFKFIFSNLFPYEHSKIDILKVEKYRDREKKIFIEKYLEGRYGKRLPDSIIEDILILPQTNNFLYLKILLNELIVKARFETLETLFDYYSKAKDSTELFYLSFLRMEDTYGELIVKEILSIIYFSKDGVSENTLLDIINFESDDFSQAEIYPFLSFINEYLIRIEGNIKIFHKVFEEAIRNHYLKDKKFVIDIRSKIGNYLQRFKKESGEEIAENLFESREVPHNRYNFIRSMTDIRIFLGTDIEKTVERFSVFPEPSRFHTTIFHNLKNKKSKLLKDEILLKEYIEHIFNLTEVTIQYFPDNISKMKDVINFYIQSLDKFGKNPLHIANLRMSLGKVLEHEGHYQRGLDTLQLSLNTYRKYEEEHPNISIIYEYFGNIYKKQKNFFESEKNFLNAINFFKQYLELEELNIGFLYKGLGDVYIEQYKYAKKNIWQEYQRELQKENSEKVVILEPVFRKKSPKVDRKKELQNSYLDKLQREKDSLKKSEEYYNDSMDYLKTILTPLHKEVKEIYSNMLFSFVELEFEKSLERLIKSYRHDIDSLINQDNKSKTQFKKDVILEVKKMKSEVLKF
jgi:tetratricopeptide (TPR) repeat protein